MSINYEKGFYIGVTCSNGDPNLQTPALGQYSQLLQALVSSVGSSVMCYFEKTNQYHKRNAMLANWC